MHYMFTPLDQHFDLGFGAMANSFMESADLLSNPEPVKPFLNSHLPVSYLYRHSVELFLKSSIVILHRALELPYGDTASDSEPKVFVGTKWRLMFEVHGLVPLNSYARSLFEKHAEILRERTHMAWYIGPEFDGWINAIEATDSSSTFFSLPDNEA